MGLSRSRGAPFNRLQIFSTTPSPTTTTTTTRPTTTTTTSRPTTTTPPPTTPLTTRAPTTRIVLMPDTNQFSPDVGSERNPYLSIDTKKFPVLDAVPRARVPDMPREDIRVMSQPLVIEPQEDVVHIPDQFSPVPAVPDASTHSDRRDINEKVEDDDEIEINEGVNDDPIIITSTSSTLRKQFKRCHGKCVQKFCLPIGDLTVYENCSNKCKGICSQ